MQEDQSRLELCFSLIRNECASDGAMERSLQVESHQCMRSATDVESATVLNV